MPSGLTSKIYEGKPITMEEYILKCARQFGGFMHMRDEDYNAPFIPRKVDLAYFDNNIARAKEQLEHYKSLTVEEVEQEVEEDYKFALDRHHDRVNKSLEILKRYDSMLEKVIAWEPPTAEHLNLKDFAIKQIQESIEWDCDIVKMSYPVKESADVWLKNSIDGAQRTLDHYIKRKEEEIKNVESANKWVYDLLESLGGK